MKKRLKPLLFAAFLATLAVTAPPAIWYALNYDRSPPPATTVPVVVQVAVVDATPHLANLRKSAAKYTLANPNVRVMVLNVRPAHLDPHMFCAIIKGENDALHAFITHTSTATQAPHATAFLDLARQELLNQSDTVLQIL